MCAHAWQADGSRELEYRAGEEEPKQAPGAEPKQAPPGKTPEPKPGEAGRDEGAAENEEGAADGQVNDAEQEQYEDRSFAAPQVCFGLPSCAFDQNEMAMRGTHTMPPVCLNGLRKKGFARG